MKNIFIYNYDLNYNGDTESLPGSVDIDQYFEKNILLHNNVTFQLKYANSIE